MTTSNTAAPAVTLEQLIEAAKLGLVQVHGVFKDILGDRAKVGCVKASKNSKGVEFISLRLHETAILNSKEFIFKSNDKGDIHVSLYSWTPSGRQELAGKSVTLKSAYEQISHRLNTMH